MDAGKDASEGGGGVGGGSGERTCFIVSALLSVGDEPMSPSNPESRNIEFMFVTDDVSHPDRSALNEVAPKNMDSMVVTAEVFHAPMSPENEDANQKVRDMSVTDDVSQPPISLSKLLAP